MIRPAGSMLLLEVAGHRLGIWRADGVQLRPSELAAGQVGHRVHQCAPAAERQLSLWDAP